jgi:UDP-glucose 4-epimerase
MRALVTGGAGFIGSNLANHLADAGHDVIALDDLSLGTWANVTDGVETVTASVLDDDLPVSVDVVFHLAARSSYQMHETDPVTGCRVNVEGFVNVVEQARRAGCDTIVYASTSSIYGNRTDPTPEDAAVAVNTGYEASKVARERYAEYFSNHYGMSLAGLRLFSVYQGYAGQESHKGEYANLISQFADAIAHGDAPVIYGDGTQTRDFTHVTDVVAAFEAAAEAGLGGIYNVGTGASYSLNDLVARLNDTLDTDITPEYVENPIPEQAYVHDTCADTRELEAATDWSADVSFAEGVRRVCAPYR